MSTTAVAEVSDTPILDRLSPWPPPAKQRFWQEQLRFLFALAIFLGLLWILVSGYGAFLNSLRHEMYRNVQEIFANDWAGVRVILTAFGIIFAWFPAVAVHECGHLIAGLAVGFRFRFLHVGRTQVDRSFRLSRISQSDVRRLGGVSFYAQEMKGCPWRYAFMIFAGPAANLVVTCVVLSLPFQKSVMWGAFILVCSYLGVVNLGPWESDGKGLLTILFRRSNHEARIALAQIYEQVGQGVEYECLPLTLIAQATSLKEKSARTVVAHLAAFQAYYYRDDYEAAAASLENCFRWSPWASAAIREGLIYSAGVMQAKRGRADLAEQWYSELPATLTSIYRLQIEGAIFEARGDINGALGKIAECEDQLAQESDEKKRASVLKRLKKWKTEIERRSTAVSLKQSLGSSN